MSVSLSRDDFVTVAGSVMAAVGAFMPIVSIAGLSDFSYADAADPEVYLLVALALAASVLIFLGKRGFSMFAAIGAWLVLLWPVIKNMGGGGDDDGGLLGKVTDAVKDPAERIASELFSNVFDMQVGGYVFLVGMIVVLYGSIRLFLASR